MTINQTAPDDTSIFLDMLFSWDGDEASSFKSVFYTFVADDGETRMSGVAAQSKATLLQQIKFYIRKDRDLYVTLGSQITAAEPKPGDKADKWRKANKFASNIKAHKTLYVDVDVGKEEDKSYATVEEAYLAIDQFCADAGLPLPSLRVQSGGGIHAYWVMPRAIPKDEWTPLAEALKAALIHHGLKCDAMCTADAARILRVPGSYNHKIPGQPRPVQIYDPGQIYPKEVLEAALAPYRGMATPHTPKPAPSGTVVSPTAFNKNFSDGMDHAAMQVDLALLADNGCGVIADGIDTGGATHSQPLWNLMMLAATFDTDPRAMAHTLSDGYPRYDVAETDNMLARKIQERLTKNMGWPSCAQIHGSSTTSKMICEQCPFYNRIKSPFDLRNQSTVQAAPAPAVTTGLNLPDGFWASADNRIHTKIVIDKKGTEREVSMLYHPVHAVWLMDDPFGIVLVMTIEGKQRYIAIEAVATATERDLVKALLNQGVLFPTANEKLLRNFMVSWTEKLQSMSVTKMRHQRMGWSKEGFVLGTKLFTPSGEQRAFTPDEGLAARYEPKGDLKVWQDAAAVLSGHTELELIMASAFAAPLVELTGMNGLMVSAFSEESGVGKTTALKIAQAVWGSPDYMMQINDTENAVLKRISELRTLPIYYDELRMKKDLDRVSDFVFQVVQGREKQRLDASMHVKEVQAFNTMVLACSNQSMVGLMTRANKHTAAGINRVLEFRVPPLRSSLDTPDVMNRIALLNSNYGRAGSIYADYLARNKELLKKEILSTMKWLNDHLQCKPEDRFWLVTMTVLLAGAIFASRLGLFNFNLQGITNLLTTMFKQQGNRRKNNISSVSNDFTVTDIVMDFIRDETGKRLLVTNKVWPHAGRPPLGEVKPIETLMPMQAQGIVAQFGVDDNRFRVIKRVFDDYIIKIGYDTTTVIEKLETMPDYSLNLKTLGSGTGRNVTDRKQTICYEFTLPADIDLFTSSTGS